MPIIDDLNATIEKLMEKEFGAPLPFDMSFAAPRRDFTCVSPEKPTVSFYLYDIRENTELRSNEPLIEKQSDGTVIQKRPPARIRLSYCVTAWSAVHEDAAGTHTRDEHKQLGGVLTALIKYPTLPSEALSGSLIGQLPPLPTTVVLPDGMDNVAQFWNALDGVLKPFLDYRVTVSLDFHEPVAGPMVITKISEYGQDDSIYVLTVRPELQLDHPKSTSIARADIDAAAIVALNSPARKGDATITVNDAEHLSTNDFLMVLDGRKTEFCRLGEVPAASAEIPLAESLRYDHSTKTELKRLSPSPTALGVKLAAVASSGSSELQVKQSDASKLHMGDVLKLDDSSEAEYCQVIAVSGPHKGMGGSEGFVHFGGIVANSASPAAPVVGAKITLVDAHGTKVAHTTSDAEGRYVFRTFGIGTGTCELEVEAQGYKSKTRAIANITSAKRENLIVNLEPG